MPAGILRSLFERSLDNPEPVLVSSRIIINTTKPIVKDLLCAECEELFNKGGEAWISQIIARRGSFPLARAVQSCPRVVDDANLVVYSCKGNPEIEIEKLTYFALSMFWRSSAVDWSSIAPVPRIVLGEREEPVRQFLRRDAPLPSDIVLIVTLWTHEPSNLQVVLPAESRQVASFNAFTMSIPGIQFVLFTGADVPADVRAQCVCSSDDQAIAVANAIDTVLTGKMQANFQAAHRTPKIAAKYRDYLRGRLG